MIKHVYIFVPNPEWQYMGGVIIVAANSYEEAITVLREDKNTNDIRFYPSLEEGKKAENQGVFFFLYDVYEKTNWKAEVLFYSYNWG